MQPFLESLAIHLIRQGGPDLGDLRIILPNRRSGLFLQHHLAHHSQGVQWAPRICAINDYINEISELQPADPVELLFILYDIYSGMVDQPDPFDQFYFWGEIMLRDFDELDKYLVDAGMLFTNVIDLKELEEPLAGLEPEQVEFIRQFWEGFHEGDSTPEKVQFLEMWERLPMLYDRLREQLMARGEGYQGMQYREIAERILQGNLEPDGARIMVVGFNALNGCEKQIFTWLKNQGAEFFWDFDRSYTDNELKEAGRFMRENLKHFPGPATFASDGGSHHENEIRIFELPTDVLQAKTIHRILEEDPVNNRECTDTAVVLCDEDLLMPVITSLPEPVMELNVTMGYPMNNTPVFSLLEALFRLQHNMRRTSKGVEQFYHKDVLAILMHPYLRNSGGETAQPLLEEMTASNRIMVEKQLFSGTLGKLIFREVDGSAELLEYLREIYMQILENLSGEEDQKQRVLDREFIFQILIQLNKLEHLVANRSDLTYEWLQRLLQKMVSALRVPFEGEPLSGLQIMGILETRLLDFRHVILLSMNEEVMPASHAVQSYIPYSLRIAFGLPAREEMDAIYAYYFNRLLQRAEKIDLLYNSASEGVRTGEMSRYLYQLIFEKKIEVIRPGMDIMARITPSLEVSHDPDTNRKLEKYTADGPEARFLSPSAINTYIDCSLKFYLRYLAGIGEPEEVQEEIDAAGFGTVIHESIRVLYSEIGERNQGTITGEALKQLLSSDRSRQVLDQVFREYHFRGRKHAIIEGRNIILFRVMFRFLEKIIQTDTAIAPFTLVSLEETHRRRLDIQVGGRQLEVRMGGKIDRVDRVGSTLRVIDYKSGNARTGFSTLASLYDTALGNRNSAALQTLFYAWLVAPDHPGEPVMPGLYVMKELYNESFDPALFMGLRGSRTRIESFSELEDAYLELLKKVLESLFDSQTPFIQTEQTARCRYCDFAAICNRKYVD